MRLLKYFLILTLILPVLLVGCPPSKVNTWFRYIGDDGGDEVAFSVTKAHDGGFVLAGHLESSHELDDDVAVIRIDDTGNVVWTKTFGDEREDTALDIQTVSGGGYIIAGQFGNQFDPDKDGFLFKIDDDGEEEWIQVFDSGGMDQVLSVEETSDGGFLIGLQLDYLATSQVVMLKTDAIGEEEWRFVVAEGAQLARAFTGADNNCYIAWWAINIDDKFDFSSTLDIMVVSLDGDFITGTTLLLPEVYALKDARSIPDGGIVLAGQADVMNVNTTMFVMRFDENLDWTWSEYYGSAGRDTVEQIKPTSDGGFILTGAEVPPDSRENILLLKLDQHGNQIWKRTYGDEYIDIGYDVLEISPEGYLVVGSRRLISEDDGQRHNDILVLRTDKNGRVSGM